MDNEIQRIKKELSLVEKRKKNLENDIDNILNEDKHSKRKRMDLNKRLDQTYNKLDDLEDALAMAKEKKNCLRRSLNN